VSEVYAGVSGLLQCLGGEGGGVQNHEKEEEVFNRCPENFQWGVEDINYRISPTTTRRKRGEGNL